MENYTLKQICLEKIVKISPGAEIHLECLPPHLVEEVINALPWDEEVILGLIDANIEHKYVLDIITDRLHRTNKIYILVQYLIEKDLISPKNGLGMLPRNLMFSTTMDLQVVVQLLSEKKITQKNIMKHFSCAYSTFMDTIYAKEIEIPTLRPGCKPKEITEEEIIMVEELRNDFQIGYQRMAQTISETKHINMTEYRMNQIYSYNDMFINEEAPKEELHTLRFVAEKCNYLWHTDLHFWDTFDVDGVKTTKPLIAFIDDRSRKILYWEILPDKSMESTANALRKCLQSNPPPHLMTIDNGKEFVGKDFQRVLETNEIMDHRIHPYTPQENGKIERFWGTLEKTLVDHSKIEMFFTMYNTVWYHSALSKMVGKKCTPQQAWETMAHYIPGEKCGFAYD